MNKVLILQPKEDSGCDWYRLRQFATTAGKEKLLDVHYIDLSLPIEKLIQVIDEADAYILRLSDSISFEVFDQFEWDKIKKPIFVDIDDNYECVDPLSDMYKVYGTQEVQLRDGTYLHQDGVTIDIEANKKRLEKYKGVLKKSTAIIVTTFGLKQYAQQYNENVVVIPNAIDKSIFPYVKDPEKDEIRLLWAGGSTHYPDLVEIKDSLSRLMNSNPNLHFYMLGVPFHGIVKDLPSDRVHPLGWVKPDGHGYRLACINADIGICPLKDMDFNIYKSSVKYYEYSSLKVPTIAKKMAPYTDDIIHNQSGLLYTTPEEFEDYVQELIDNPVKRISLASEAQKYVYGHRDLTEITKDWSSFINQVIKVFND